MAKAPRPWIVTPHTPLRKLEENLWVVESNVPGVPMPRRMSIVRRSDGTLAFYQAVPVDDATLATVTALGKPAILIVPHNQHGMDANPFAERLGVKIYGPKKSEAKMRSKFNMTGTIDDVPPDPAVTFQAVDGSKNGEVMAIVRSPGGRVSLIFADAYMACDSKGLNPMLRLAGFGGGPKVAPAFKLFDLRDKPALRTRLEGLAATPGLAHLIPCHGVIDSTDPAGSLRKAIATI